MIDIRTRRVYDSAHADNGFRVLVDRVWPRGMTKEQVQASLWLKEVAPSTSLRKWFRHDRAKWDEFRTRYFTELGEQTEAVEQLLLQARQGTLTLLYSAREREFNQAVALKEYLLSKLR